MLMLMLMIGVFELQVASMK